MTDDPLGVLGLDETTASPGRIKARYRELAALAHPDAPGGSHDAMTQLNDARKAALAASIAAPCPACEGRGKVTLARGNTSLLLTCAACRGTRRRWNDHA